MFLSDTSLKRPVAMLCLLIALTFLGINSYRKIGLELIPATDVPFITVTTVYPGATPNDIEVDVAKKMEDSIITVDGIKNITSICLENMVQTMIEFEIGTNVDVAATDVREKIDTILSDFPEDVEKPIVLKLDINATPIINMALTGDIPLEDIYDYADNTLSDKLSGISGVAKVELIGGSKREVHVELDPLKLAEANITAINVIQALNSGIFSIPAGRIKTGNSEYNVKFDAEYHSIKDIGTLQITGKDGKRRYLKDVANISMSNEENRQAAFLDNQKAIVIKIVKRSEANAVEVVNNVKDQMDSINAQLPGGLDLTWFTDNGGFIEATANSTITNIFVGILLTAIILFFFLFNPRSTIIIVITMPLTIIITLFFLYSMDYTMNIMTLLAAGLSVGVLVTNSIVVMESILSKLKKMGDPWKAAKEGTSEVATAIFASAGTNVVVFFPIAMMGGIVGMMFRPFAWTMLTVNVVSLFISFTLTPILCAFLLKKLDENSLLHKLEDFVNGYLNRLISTYMSIVTPLLSTIKGCLLLIFIAFVVFMASLSLFSKIGSEFTPTMDQNRMMITYEFPTTQRLETTIERTKELEKKFTDVKGLESVLTTIGKVDSGIGQASEGAYVSQSILRFKSLEDRDWSVMDMLSEVRHRLENEAGVIISVSIPSIMGGQELPVELDIYGDDLDELDKLAINIKKAAEDIDGFVGVDISSKPGKTEINISPDRTILSDVGIPPVSLGTMLRANIEGIKSGIYKSGDRSYDIRVKMQEYTDKKQINSMVYSRKDEQPLTLEGITNIKEKIAPVKIIRSNKNRTVKLYSNLEKGFALDKAVSALNEKIEKENILPPGYSIKWRGNYEMMDEAGAEFMEAALLAIILTFLTLAAILESFIKPVFIMVTLPLALIGIAVALFVTSSSISIFVMLGAVMLIGIVVNNAVLIFERMHVLIDQGEKPGKAMIDAIHDEFRPILMITLAAVLGMLPLAIATGMGSELTTGIGISSIGGIIVSAMMTLIIIPAIYELYLKLKK